MGRLHLVLSLALTLTLSAFGQGNMVNRLTGNFGGDGSGLANLRGTSSNCVDKVFLAFYGDSMTWGNPPFDSYPWMASYFLGGLQFTNAGISGQTSDQIAARWLADSTNHSNFLILFTGNNDSDYFAQTRVQISNCVCACSYVTNFLILGDCSNTNACIGTTDYTNVLSLNTNLAALYTNHFIDIRSVLKSYWNPNLPQDVADHAIDVIPDSLRWDRIHLNSNGKAIIARAVAMWWRSKSTSPFAALSANAGEPYGLSNSLSGSFQSVFVTNIVAPGGLIIDGIGDVTVNAETTMSILGAGPQTNTLRLQTNGGAIQFAGVIVSNVTMMPLSNSASPMLMGSFQGTTAYNFLALNGMNSADATFWGGTNQDLVINAQTSHGIDFQQHAWNFGWWDPNGPFVVGPNPRDSGPGSYGNLLVGYNGVYYGSNNLVVRQFVGIGTNNPVVPLMCVGAGVFSDVLTCSNDFTTLGAVLSAKTIYGSNGIVAVGGSIYGNASTLTNLPITGVTWATNSLAGSTIRAWMTITAQGVTYRVPLYQ